MTESGTPPAGDGTPPPAPSPAEPRILLAGQYIRDLSFENPNAPGSLRVDVQPQVQISVQVNAAQRAPNLYEASLQINATAKRGEETVFVVELVYGGLFNFENIPANSLQALCLIECPRLLFPFARRIVADVTRDGGFPPLLMEPVDFALLYRRRLASAAAAGQPSASS
ncbi:MAG: protein-export chaperone SecB [Alphaproteobacteria bacterium]|nr:protein-export chaperone SecB [Alphaproteobacteria bacterium]